MGVVLLVAASPAVWAQTAQQQQANVERARRYCEIVAKWTADTPHWRHTMVNAGDAFDIAARSRELVLDESFAVNFGVPFDQFNDHTFFAYTALPQCLTQGPNFLNNFGIKALDAAALRKIFAVRGQDDYSGIARDARRAVPEIDARIPKIETALAAANPKQGLEALQFETRPFLDRAPGAAARRFRELYAKAVAWRQQPLRRPVRTRAADAGGAGSAADGASVLVQPAGPEVRVLPLAGSPPANIKAMLAVDKHGILRWLGTQSAKSCPDTRRKARDLRFAAIRESWFPAD